MGAALAFQRGESKNTSDTVRRLATTMSEKDLRDFASRVETPKERRKRYSMKAQKHWLKGER